MTLHGRNEDQWMDLLDVDLAAGAFDLLFDLVRLVLGHTFFDRLRSPLDEFLGFLQTQRGDPPDLLDDLDLLVTKPD